jgi:hypothetical protein
MIEEKIGREIAAAGDHRLRQFQKLHRAADAAMDDGIGIPIALHAKDGPVHNAAKAIADMETVIESQSSGFGGVEERKEHGDLHRAGRVKPAVAIMSEFPIGFQVVGVDADGRAATGGAEFLDTAVQCGFVHHWSS